MLPSPTAGALACWKPKSGVRQRMRLGGSMSQAERIELDIPPQRAVVGSCGRLAGYAGDVWYPQPCHPSHPWRTMPNNAMTPHISGSTLSAQARYAAGTREILDDWFAGWPIRDEYLIVDDGRLAGTGAAPYSVAGDSSRGAAASSHVPRNQQGGDPSHQPGRRRSATRPAPAARDREIRKPTTRQDK